MSREKVLIVEDDKDLVEAMKLTLQAKDYNVLTAFNTEDGLKLIKDEKPGLIILDVMFGAKEETKGFDFALELRKDKEVAKIPILMLTSVNGHYPTFHFSPDKDQEYLPVDEFINKPAQPDELVEKVEKLLLQKVSKWENWPNPKE